jgi:hypothetical protein
MHLGFAGLRSHNKSTLSPIYSGALSKEHFSTYNALIWLLTGLIICTYFMFLYTSYGSEVSKVFLQVDQAFFKSIVHSLEKNWSLFPASLENISNIETPYHHLDSQIKWLFTHFMPTNSAFFVVNVMIYSFLGYSIFRLKIPNKFSILLLLFVFSVLKLPQPDMILQMFRLPLDFTIRSSIFGNSNTILAFALLTYIWDRIFFIRLLIYSLLFYVKSPAAPAFFLIEIYLLFFSDRLNREFSLKNQIIKFLLVILTFFASYYFFFYSVEDGISSLVKSVNWITFRVRNDIIWFADGKLLYDIILLILTIRFSTKSNKKILICFYYIVVVFLIVYDSVGLIKINISAFGVVDWFLRYALLMIILHLNSEIQVEGLGNRLLNTIILSIIVINCYFFAHFFGALISKNYHRFSGYVDNFQLIEIVSPITNKNDIVAFNTVDSPIRKDKQLQLCGIIKNPLWVSNLIYLPASVKGKVATDWKILQQALKGKEKFPVEITWLILDKSKNNYSLKTIYQEFFVAKETNTHILLKKNE